MRTMAESLIARALRPSRRSKNTLPLQTITRLTLSGLMSPSHSPLTALNLLSANSASGDTDSLWRSRLFGVKITSGLTASRSLSSHRFLVAQQALRGEDNERLAVRPDHLPAQEKKHLHRGRRNAHLDVIVGAELKVSLRAPRRMLGPLPLVAVRQEHHQAAAAAPFDLARGDELVDHHLRAVRKIAELRLPDNQLVGLGGRIAVLEAEHGLFGEH